MVPTKFRPQTLARLICFKAGYRGQRSHLVPLANGTRLRPAQAARKPAGRCPPCGRVASKNGRARWPLTGLDMKEAANPEVALSYRRPGIEKLGNGGEKLRWRERFGQENAARDAICGPLVGTCGGHIDDGECRVDLSGQFRDFPSIHLALPEINVGYECAAFAPAFLQQGQRLFARR
jgi:hypothetical protein